MCDIIFETDLNQMQNVFLYNIVTFDAVSKSTVENTVRKTCQGENGRFSNQPGFVRRYYCRHHNFDTDCASAGKLDVLYVHRLFLDFEVT